MKRSYSFYNFKKWFTSWRITNYSIFSGFLKHILKCLIGNDRSSLKIIGLENRNILLKIAEYVRKRISYKHPHSSPYFSGTIPYGLFPKYALTFYTVLEQPSLNKVTATHISRIWYITERSSTINIWTRRNHLSAAHLSILQSINIYISI